MKIIKNIYHNIINFKLRVLNSKKKVLFHSNSRIDKNCFFEGMNAVGVNSILKNTNLGLGTYVGRNNELNAVKIGKFCSIGSFIINTTGRHPSSVFISTHPAFFSKGKAAGYSFVKENKYKELIYNNDNYLVTIGNDVWIGDRVTILDGVKIGDGAIIGSNALVTKDIAPYTINVGVPANPVRKRFEEEEIKYLLSFKWWDKDLSWIKEHAELFENIEHLKNKYEN
jgi:acetyltransferase-like isoleucine patch superfamily enzyme